MYSDQPVMPSSVVIFKKELPRQPASQCRSSILVIFTRLSLPSSGHHAPPGRAASTPRIEARRRPEDNRAGEKGGPAMALRNRLFEFSRRRLEGVPLRIVLWDGERFEFSDMPLITVTLH